MRTMEQGLEEIDGLAELLQQEQGFRWAGDPASGASNAAEAVPTSALGANRGPGGLPILRGPSQPTQRLARPMPASLRAARECGSSSTIR